MSRQGRVGIRPQHDISRPGKDWLQKLVLKKSKGMQQAAACVSWYPLLCGVRRNERQKARN
jgi:hypothetical protein